MFKDFLEQYRSRHFAAVEDFLGRRFGDAAGVVAASEAGYAIVWHHPHPTSDVIVWEHSLQHPDGTLEPIAKTELKLVGGNRDAGN